MTTIHTDLPDAGRTDHFQIDERLPNENEKDALQGTPTSPSSNNLFLTEAYATLAESKRFAFMMGA